MSERLSWVVLALALSAAPSFAQSLVCHPIRPGESAAQAARRVAGTSRNLYSASFQIMDGSSRFVPKSQYDRRLRAGWRACVARPAARAVASRQRPEPAPTPAVAAVAESDVAAPPDAILAAPEPVAAFRVSAEAAAAPVLPHPAGGIDLTIVWVGTAIAVPWFGLYMANGYLTRRKTAAVLVQHFAHRFITEFERPLLRYDDAEPPLKARVRARRRGRFEILLAPGAGRRYPNLGDHKRNVEYDVGRVMSALDDPAFVNGALYTQDEWVVVPFTCRSSY